MNDLSTALAEAATRSPLLVASDYDGVLSPIVDDPNAAHPDEAAMAALRDLAGSRGVHVAVISGRTLADLERLSGEPARVALIGSHGAETGAETGVAAVDGVALDRLVRDMQHVADRFPGAWVEQKPAGVAFHYRNVVGQDQIDALRLVRTAVSVNPEHRVMEGKKIVEVSLAAGHKGDALERMRIATGAAAVVFLGDDVTDEDAFATLRPGDVGIKVGPEPTAASHRVPGQPDVAGVLRRLAAARTGD